MDFFNYGNAPSGTSTSVPVFAVLNTADPDRLGTMVVGFDTSGSVAAGLEPSRYAVTAVRLVLNLQNSLLYDPTPNPRDRVHRDPGAIQSHASRAGWRRG
jgi:hypothetical protein